MNEDGKEQNRGYDHDQSQVVWQVCKDRKQKSFRTSLTYQKSSVILQIEQKTRAGDAGVYDRIFFSIRI